MKNLIIGIFAYLIVLIPGYYFIVPDDTDQHFDNKSSINFEVDSNSEKSSELEISNPGDAPPPK